MKFAATAATLSLALAASSQAALYNVSYSLVGTRVDPYDSNIVTNYDFQLTGQINVVNGVAVSGSVTVVDATTFNVYGYPGFGTHGDMSGTYSLLAGDGSGNVQTHWSMGFDNRFNVNAANPLSVGTSSFHEAVPGLTRMTSGGLMFVMDGANPAFNAITIFQQSNLSSEFLDGGFTYGLKLQGIENDAAHANGGTLTYSPVPAPGAIALLGLAGMAARRRRG